MKTISRHACLILISIIIFCCPGKADALKQNFGVDYAFLALMAISPDFSAANYTIENPSAADVKLNIGRFPHFFNISKSPNSVLKGELSVAYQKTEQVVTIFPAPGEYIDSQWITYGGNIGLLYERRLNQALSIVPSFRFGLLKMKNEAKYIGPFTTTLKDQFDGEILNWSNDASISIAGLGLKYLWTILDRSSRIEIDTYHILVDSFNEPNETLKFRESANMLTINTEVISPTKVFFNHKRFDWVLMVGGNYFFGENRNALGYTTSYNVGAGGELPIKFKGKQYGHVRLSGTYLWADGMRGWMLSVGYNPE